MVRGATFGFFRGTGLGRKLWITIRVMTGRDSGLAVGAGSAIGDAYTGLPG
jgi:hypothetical protein